MLESVARDVVSVLAAAGINASCAYSVTPVDETEELVCVRVGEMRIVGSGLGSYIGIASESGQVTELYGEKAYLTLKLELYRPFGSADTLTDAVRGALYGAQWLSVMEFTLGQTVYDEKSRMLKCPCSARAQTYLVHEKSVRPSVGTEAEV